MTQAVGIFLMTLFGLGMAMNAHAALESRLGGLAYYDTVLDITWMRNANAIAGTAWDDGSSNTDGLVTWYSAMDWAQQISLNGIPGWKLPTQDVDGDGVVVECEFVSEAECRDNHYGYMYFFNGVTGENPGPFAPYLIGYGYWSSAEYVEYPEIIAWLFTFGLGQQHPLGKAYWRHAWAVRDGDIAAFKNGVLSTGSDGAPYAAPAYAAYDGFSVDGTVVVTGIDWYGTEPGAGGYAQTAFQIFAGAPNAGTPVSSGTAVAARVDTGMTTPQGDRVYEYSLRGLNITLTAGSYYLGLSQQGVASGAAWLPASGSPHPDASYRSLNGTVSGPLSGDQYFRVIGYGISDGDNDGLSDDADNCPALANADQSDSDGNGVGDACEPPRLSGLWPANAAIGETISLFVFGNHFDAAGGVQVFANGVALPLVQVVTPDMLIVRFTVTADMFGPVSITTANGTAQGADFGVPMDGLQVSGTWPGSAAVDGRVFVFGNEFAAGTMEVRVGATVAPLVHVLNENLFIFVVPSGAVTAPVYVTNATATAGSPTDLVITP